MSVSIHIADMHLRPYPPLNRKESFVEQMFRKVEFLIEYANERKANVFVAGDLLDRATNHPSWFLNKVMDLMGTLEGVWHIIPGNHDLLGHDLAAYKGNSIYTISFCPNVVFHTTSNIVREGGSAFYMTPFAAKPHRIVDNRPVMVGHVSVYEGQIPFYDPNAFNQYTVKTEYPGFDRYFLGDIHIPAAVDGVYVPGSMLRLTAAQKEHRPRFYVMDNTTHEVETIFFPIEEDVWKLVSEAKESVMFKSEIEELVKTIEAQGEMLSYGSAAQKLSGKYWPEFDRLINEYKAKSEA